MTIVDEEFSLQIKDCIYCLRLFSLKCLHHAEALSRLSVLLLQLRAGHFVTHLTRHYKEAELYGRVDNWSMRAVLMNSQYPAQMISVSDCQDQICW